MKNGKMNILVAGYYGMDNLGDELILSEIVRGIKNAAASADLKAQITVLSGDPAATSANYSVAARSRKNIFAVFSALSACDMLIVGGGGLFQDRTSSFSLYYYLALIFSAKILGKKVSVCAVGIDRMKKFNTKLTCAALSFADSVSVRDVESAECLSGCRRRPLCVADLAINIEHPAVSRVIAGESPGAFIFVPRRISGVSHRFWAALADTCSRRFKAEIKIIPFHKKQDLRYAMKIAGAMHSSAEVVMWDNPAEAVKIFSGARMVVSARLHGIILAAACGVPLCGFSGDIKSDIFLREIAQKNIYREEHPDRPGEEAVAAAISDTLRWADDFKSRLTSAIERLRRMSSAAVPAALEPLRPSRMSPERD